jgi:hypothetical protein
MFGSKAIYPNFHAKMRYIICVKKYILQISGEYLQEKIAAKDCETAAKDSGRKI